MWIGFKIKSKECDPHNTVSREGNISCVSSTSFPFIKTLSSALHAGLRGAGAAVTEPMTGRHLSQIWFDKAQSSRVGPQQGTRVPAREGPVALSVSQHSPVCATNPNEAALCGWNQGPVCGDLSEGLNNQGKMWWSKTIAYHPSGSHTHKGWQGEGCWNAFHWPTHYNAWTMTIMKE